MADFDDELDLDSLSAEELQKLVLKTQAQTALITLKKAQREIQQFDEIEESRKISNSQRQAHLAKVAARAEYIQREVCLHKQGGGPEDQYEGDGKSCLTLARVFFSNNYLIQCNRCDLAIQRPHPSRKSKRPIFDGETQAEIKERIAKYTEDVKYYESLLKEAKSNKLRPMLGPTWEFQNEDGVPIIPEWK